MVIFWRKQVGVHKLIKRIASKARFFVFYSKNLSSGFTVAKLFHLDMIFSLCPVVQLCGRWLVNYRIRLIIERLNTNFIKSCTTGYVELSSSYSGGRQRH